MLFKCFECGGFGFRQKCPQCRRSENAGERPRKRSRIPIDPALLPNFDYSATGLLEKVLPPVRRSSEQEWDEYVEGLLDNYREFREPYFVNFLHLGRRGRGSIVGGGGHSDIDLLKNLLARLGFDELDNFRGLVPRLVRSTELQQEYRRFAQRAEGLVSSNLRSTLRSWIEARGTVFRQRLPLMLYFLWREGHHRDEVNFSPSAPPLVRRSELRRNHRLCDEIHFDLLLERLQTTLEQFDPSDYVTMYDVDAMSGPDFETFVEDLFRARGFEVRGTQQTADQGADVFAERFGREVVAQVKNYGGSVGNAAVQQAISAREFYGCDGAMVVTNSRFTASAEELAESSDVRLVDRDELQDYLDDYNRWVMGSGGQSSSDGGGASVGPSE